MIEGIAAIGTVGIGSPSVGHGTAYRKRRLNWLSSLRATGATVDEPKADDAESAPARAQIADALSLAEELRAAYRGTAEEADAATDGPSITAAALALRITASADRSLAAQAHVGAAAVRRYVGGDDENPQ